KLPVGWEERFLTELERTGGYHTSAKAAGVSHETIRRYRQADPAFAQKCRDAVDLKADRLEQELEEMGRDSKGKNPVPHIVRLKALRPAAYIEKQAVVSLPGSFELEPADATSLLRRLLENVTPTTLKKITGLADKPQRLLDRFGADPPAPGDPVT